MEATRHMAVFACYVQRPQQPAWETNVWESCPEAFIELRSSSRPPARLFSQFFCPPDADTKILSMRF